MINSVMKYKAILIFLLLSLSFCESSQHNKIGFFLPDMSFERSEKDKKYFEEKAKELGFEIAFYDAGGDAELQYHQVLEAIDAGVKVIVIGAVNANKAAAIVRKAHMKNVKVIAYDRLIKNSDLDYYVSHDNIKVGELMANYAVSKAPKGNYVLLYGDWADQNAIFVKEGILNVLGPSIKDGNISIVYSCFVDGWSPVEAEHEVERFFQLSSDSVNVIISSSDDISIGVVKYLRELGCEDKVIVTGQNANLASIKSIVDGEQKMTIYKPLKPLAYSAANLANNLLQGETPENITSEIDNGRGQVPSVLIPVEIIDKNKVELLIDYGVYARSDIFND